MGAKSKGKNGARTEEPKLDANKPGRSFWSASGAGVLTAGLLMAGGAGLAMHQYNRHFSQTPKEQAKVVVQLPRDAPASTLNKGLPFDMTVGQNPTVAGLDTNVRQLQVGVLHEHTDLKDELKALSESVDKLTKDLKGKASVSSVGQLDSQLKALIKALGQMKEENSDETARKNFDEAVAKLKEAFVTMKKPGFWATVAHNTHVKSSAYWLVKELIEQLDKDKWDTLSKPELDPVVQKLNRVLPDGVTAEEAKEVARAAKLQVR